MSHAPLDNSSHALSDACDAILNQSGLLSHVYGIPAIASISKESQETQLFERKCVALHCELSAKVRRILYCNELIQASRSAKRGQRRVSNHLLQRGHNSADFLADQTSLVVDDALINKFLQLIAPISRAVYHERLELTLSEIGISDNLETLYSIDHGTSTSSGPSGRVFWLNQGFNDLVSSRKEMAKKVSAIKTVISNELEPSLANHYKASRAMRILEARYSKLKCQAMNSFDPVGTRKKFQLLTSRWNRLSKVSQFIQLFITTLPVNWCQDEALHSIMESSLEISSKINEYEQLVSLSTLDKLSDADILGLEFDRVDA